jgi:F-type H+-transporting ATPase subunit b
VEVFTNPESIFFFNIGTAIWMFVTFGLTFFILWRFGWKPIVEGMARRSDQVKQDTERAEQIQKDIESVKAKQEALIDDARIRSNERVKKERDEALNVRNQMIAESKQKANQQVEQAQNELEQKRQAAMAEVEQEAIAIAMLLTRKVLELKLSRSLSDQELQSALSKSR